MKISRIPNPGSKEAKEQGCPLHGWEEQIIISRDTNGVTEYIPETDGWEEEDE